MSKTEAIPRNNINRIYWLVNGLFAIILTVMLILSYRQHFQTARAQAENAAITLELSVSGMLNQVDLALISVVSTLQNPRGNKAEIEHSVDHLIQQLSTKIISFTRLGYSDASGKSDTLAGYPAGSLDYDISDRDYFQQLKNNPALGLVRTNPVKGRVTKKDTIIFARAYLDPQGNFAGVVFASIALEHFSNLFARIELGSNSAIHLITDKDFIRTAYFPKPEGDAPIGLKIVTPQIIDELSLGGPVRRFTSITKADGRERLWVARLMPDWPYWLGVGMYTDEILLVWYRELVLALFIMGIFALSTWVAARQLKIGWDRREYDLSVLQNTLEATDSGVIVTSEYGKAIHTNRRFAQMWGIPDEMVRTGDEKVMLTHVTEQLQDPQSFVQGVETLYANVDGRVLDMVYFKDGRVFERTSRPTMTHGKVNGRVWSFTDITERKRINDLLRFIAQRAWIAQGIEFLPALAKYLGKLLQVDYVLISKLEMFSESAETVGLFARDSLQPNFSYALHGTPCEHVGGHQPCIFSRDVQRLFPEDALLVEMNVESYVGIPIWDSRGSTIGIIAVMSHRPMQDAEKIMALLQLVATAAGAELERLREEKILRRERDRAQGYLDTVEAMIVVLDKDAIILQVNRKGCQLLGWDESQLIGQNWFLFCVPSSSVQAIAAAQYAQMMNGVIDNPRYLERQILTCGGEILDIAWHSSFVKNESGEIIGMLSAGEDISERKRRDIELDGYRHRLEELVNVRTKQLEKIKEEAEAANRAKSVFLANMSHELRTPLNAILGFAQLLKRDLGMSIDSRRNLQTINTAGQHLLTLIHDVLEISRIETGYTDTKLSVFDLLDLLHEVSDMIRVKAQQKSLLFEEDFSLDLPRFVKGDEQHLRQILLNLLGNAVKFTDQGKVQLRVRELNEQFSFEVSDTGQGISVDDQAHLFQPFYQTEVGVNKGDGTGLGLVISREYAHLMNGELNLVSELGIGSCFTLKVPLAVVYAPIADLRKSKKQVVSFDRDYGRIAILIVDDKPDNRQLMQQVLSILNVEIRAVDNGQSAIEQFVQWRPDLILMDMKMPVMNGYEATRQIRQLAGGDRVKIVATTASAFNEDRAAILAAGCDQMLQKPIEQELLFATIADLLNLRYQYADQQSVFGVNYFEKGSLDLSSVRKEILVQMYAAAEQLDLELVRHLIDQIRLENGDELASYLQVILDEYRFDLLANLCEEFIQNI